MRATTLYPTQQSTRRLITLFFLVALVILAASGCGQESRWDAADQASKGERATSEDAVPGGTLNQFFPTGGEAQVTFVQEKLGFAQARLEQDGQEVASLSITDSANNPNILDKFKSTDDKLSGYPVAGVGSKGTAILVGERYQVQIRSNDEGFDRETWLLEFDLQGLSAHE